MEIKPQINADERRFVVRYYEKIEGGECVGEALCDVARIGAVFAETRSKLETEHLGREARTRFHH